MKNFHHHATRNTTTINQTIGELTAQLQNIRRMPKQDSEKQTETDIEQKTKMDLTKPITELSPDQIYSLQVEVEELREKMFRLEKSQTSTLTDPNIIPMHVIVNSDPLQQMKDFVKPFHGYDQEDVHKWLESINHYFTVAQLPGTQEQLYLQYAPAFLKEIAYKWWKENKKDYWDWRMFKHALTHQFGKRNEHLIARQLDQRRQQYNESVIQYYYDIIELCNKYDSEMSDKQKIFKLTNGLRLSLYTEAIKESYATPAEFLTKVQQLENVQKLIELRQAQLNNSDDHELSSNITRWNQPTRNRYIRGQYSYNQQSIGNSNRYFSPRPPNKTIECYKCHQYGHIARHCPQQTNVTTDSPQYTNQKNQ